MRREDQHVLFSQIQHVTHLRPSEDQCFQLARLNGDFSCDSLLDLGDELVLVIGNLPLVRLVVPVVANLAEARIGRKVPL